MKNRGQGERKNHEKGEEESFKGKQRGSKVREEKIVGGWQENRGEEGEERGVRRGWKG